MQKNKNNVLDWEIKVQPVFTEGERILRGYKTILKDTEDESVVLSIMKDSYVPRTNEEFSDIVTKLALTAKTEPPVYSEYDSGRKVLAYLKNPVVSNLLAHPISDQIVIGNAHDGSSSLFVCTVINYAGSNFTYMNRKAAFRVTHRTKSLDKTFDYIEMMNDYQMEKDYLYAKFEKMGSVEITEDIIEDYIEKVMDYDTVDDEGEVKELSSKTKNKIEKMKDSIRMKMEELGNNVWALFNGATYYTSNLYVGSRKRNVDGNMYGTQNSYNQRALNYCLNLID